MNCLELFCSTEIIIIIYHYDISCPIIRSHHDIMMIIFIIAIIISRYVYY